MGGEILMRAGRRQDYTANELELCVRDVRDHHCYQYLENLYKRTSDCLHIPYAESVQVNTTMVCFSQ